MFNALKPLKKYEIYVEGRPERLKILRLYANDLGRVKSTHSDIFKYFKGMRKNWFPLLLLCFSEFYDDNSLLVKKVDESFNEYNNSPECHRFYFDGIREYGNGLIISCSLVADEDLNSMVAVIMDYYEFNYKIREIK